MKQKLFIVISLFLIFQDSFCQWSDLINDGSNEMDPVSLKLEKDSITTVTIQTDKSFYLDYHSLLPTEIRIEIVTKSIDNFELEFSMLKRRPCSGVDSVAFEKFVLTDSISNINIKAFDEQRFIKIRNIIPIMLQSKTNCELTFRIVESESLPIEEANLFNTNELLFSFNKESYSSFLIFNVDTLSLITFGIPNDTINEYFNFDFTIYDSSLNRVGIIDLQEDTNCILSKVSFEKGKYYLKISNCHWAGNVFPEILMSNKLKIYILKSEFLPPQPNYVKLLSKWLFETGLNKYFKVTFYHGDSTFENNFMTPSAYRMFNERKYAITAERSLWNINDSNEREKMLEFMQNNFYADYSKFSNENWYDRKNEPTFFLYLFAVEDNKEALKELEEKYQEEFNVSIWRKIFDKIRLYANVPFEKILVYVSIPCSREWIYESFGSFYRNGMLECEFGGASTLLCDLTKINTTSSAQVLNLIGVGNNAEQFLEEMFGNSSDIEFLEKTQYSFSVIIRNVKGYILKGEDYWEKIEISCYIQESGNQKYLQVQTDGLYTTGGGSYPKDSQFDISFEPLYKHNLIEFSRKFVTDYKTYLSP